MPPKPRFSDLLGFELRLHTRQVGFWVAAAALFLFGMLVSSSDFISISLEGGARVKNNGAIPVALNVSILSLLSIFFGAVFVVTGVMRDDVHKSLEIVHATPVSTPSLLLSRMLGVWIVTVVAITAGILGLFAGRFMPWADAASFGPIAPLNYLHALAVFVLPNALLVAGIYTAIAAISRRPAVVYASAVGLFVAYLAAGIVAGQNPPDAVAAFVDPFGTGALAVETRYWPPAEQNTVLPPLEGWLGWNRLVYTVVGLAAFALAFRLATRGIPRSRRRRRRELALDGPVPRRAPLALPSFGAGHTLAAFATRVRFEYLAVVRSTAFLILVGIALTLFGITLWANLGQFNPNPTLPTSSFMVQNALGSLAIPIIIVVVFFGADIMWRDRTSQMHHILDASPVRDVSLLLAKWGALALVVLTLIAAALLVAMGVQLVVGGGVVLPIPRTYLAIGFVSFFLAFFFQGMLVMFLQNFVPGRVVGMLLSAGVLAGLFFFISRLPFYHPLMNFGSVGAGAFSEMSGFARPERLLWTLPYWGSFILVLGAVSILVWKRGIEVGLRTRLRSAGSRLSLPVAATGAVGTLAFGALAVIGARSYSADEYRNTQATERLQVAFEETAAQVADRPLPKIRDVRVDADIRPASRTADISATYRIENPHDEPIERLAVLVPVGLDNLETLEIEGATRVVDEPLADELAEADYLEMRFDPPLAPGETRTLTYAARFAGPTITREAAIQRNGTFVDSFASLPTFGGFENFYLTNPDKRRKYGLEEREPAPDRDAPGVRDENFITAYADYVDFSATICTDPGQVPVAPGRLLREYERDGRLCRDYEAERPILNFFAFLSADYEVRKDEWVAPDGRTVELAIYYHAEHDYNVDIMFAAMKQALSTFSEKFSPYPYAQLRIMEFPYRSFAQAFAGTVPFSENIGFVQDPGVEGDPKRTDFATYVTMHEIGHQWFAHQIVAANAKGGNVLSEGLTEYATMLAYEEANGFEAARRFHEVRSIQQYLGGRTLDRDPEQPLALTEADKGYMVYNKASWAFWGLREIIGDAAVERAVRNLVDTFGSKGPPYTTTQDLVDRLVAEAGPGNAEFVRDMWDRITFWRIAVEDGIEVEPLAGDRVRVRVPYTLDKRYAASEDGKETSVTESGEGVLDEPLQVGFYLEDPEDDLGANPFALETVRVTEAEGVLEFELDQRPAWVWLDPNRALIERDVNNNRREIVADDS